ncbi:MAG: type VI secretion system contractile sheath small subunit [Planctomycetes bacterium]|nr:type VI secretion system contractile sheath small subunit [Planctomycetota bacterium]
MAAADGSVAPRERVNIVYKPSTGDAQEEKELPLKLLMMGDYTQRKDETPLEERKPINIDKDNFNEVMKSQGLGLQMNVANKLSGKSGDEMAVKLKFDNLKDFEPEQVAKQVPELKQLLELRQALAALKGPLGNFPAFRKKIQQIVGDGAAREKIMKELEKKEDKK